MKEDKKIGDTQKIVEDEKLNKDEKVIKKKSVTKDKVKEIKTNEKIKKVKKVKKVKKERNISKKKKVIITLSIIIIVVIVVGIIVFVSLNKAGTKEQQPYEGLIDLTNTENAKIEDNKKVNTSEELKKDKTTNGLKISNIQLTAEGGLTNCTATVTNESGATFEGKDIKIVFKNQDGSEFAIVKGYIDTLEQGQATTLSAYTMADVANAYDFDIQI